MSKINNINFPVYVVFVENEAVFASEEYDDCDGYIDKLEEEDIDYIEEEYGMSEEDAPDTVHFMAGYYGDAQGAEIVTIDEDDVDEDSQEIQTDYGTLLIPELQDLLAKNYDE